MMKRLLLAIFIFSAVVLSAQETTRIDSLKQFIATAPDDSNKVNALYRLGTQYDLFGSKHHIEYFAQALELAKKIGYNKKGRLKIYNSLTLYLFYKEILDLSMKYSLEHLALVEELGLEKEKYRVYSLLGNLNTKLGNFKEARNYYDIIKAHCIETNNEVGLGSSYINLVIFSMETKQYDSAIIFGYKAAELYKKNGMVSELGNATVGITEALIKKGNFREARSKANEALAIYKSINLNHGIGNALYVLGQVYMNQNELDSAIIVTKLSGRYADTLNILNVERDCFGALAELYKRKNDYVSAYTNQVLFKTYSDSVAKEEQRGRMLQYEIEYSLSKKEKLVLEQKLEIDEKNKQRTYLLVGIGGAIILLLVSYRAYKQKKASSEIIAKQKELVEDKQKEILDSITYAKRIQNAILAKEEHIKKYLPHSFLLYKPKDIVAGDFYFFEVTGTHIFYAAADCTGHGVPGALMSVVCANSLTRCVNEFGLEDPGKILDKTRVLVVETLRKSGEEVKDGMDISLCAISKDLREVKWAGANNPLWFIKNTILNEIKADKQPIGFYETPKPFTTHSLALSKGDLLYLFTDGYADQFGGPKGKKFKYKQLEDVLSSISSKDTAEQVKILEEKFQNWKGDLDQVDDVCVIGIRL